MSKSETTTFQGCSSSSSVVAPIIDLNATPETKKEMGASLSLNSFNHVGRDAAYYDSNVPVVISSGIAGYVVEDVEDGASHSSDRRRLSCKRRVPEDADNQLSQQQPLTPQENSNSEQSRAETINGIGPIPMILHQPSNVARNCFDERASARTSFGMHPRPIVLVQEANGERNIRLRSLGPIGDRRSISMPPPSYVRIGEGTLNPTRTSGITVMGYPAHILGVPASNNHYPMQFGASAAARNMELPVRGGSPRPSNDLGSGSMARVEHETGTHGLQLSPRTGALMRRRRRIREVHNTLARIRTRGSLELEDVMELRRSLSMHVPEENNNNEEQEEEANPHLLEELHLNAEGMSFEQLLALGERIGDVCPGLNDDVIVEGLEQQRYRFIEASSSGEEVPCCICQEEYSDGEDLAKLNCGHDYHYHCIKQWLREKNNCPICKANAIQV